MIESNLNNSNDELRALRQKIEQCDDRLLATLIERVRAAQQIGRIQRMTSDASQPAAAAPSAPLGRYIRSHQQQTDQPPLSGAWLSHFFYDIDLISCALSQQERRSDLVGDLRSLLTFLSGHQLAYSSSLGGNMIEMIDCFQQSASQALPDQGAIQMIDCPTIHEVFNRISQGECSLAIVPIRDSFTGTIEKYFRQIIASRARVLFELKKTTQYCLWSERADLNLSAIRYLHGDQQALTQCQEWLMRRDGLAIGEEPVCLPTDSDQAALQACIGQRDGAHAAIASRRAAAEFDLTCLAEDIQDSGADHHTTFWLIASTEGHHRSLADRFYQAMIESHYSVEFCASHWYCCLPDRVGSLRCLTDLLAEKNVYLSHIKSFANFPDRSVCAASGHSHRHYFHLALNAHIDAQPVIEQAAKKDILLFVLGQTFGAPIDD